MVVIGMPKSGHLGSVRVLKCLDIFAPPETVSGMPTNLSGLLAILQTDSSFGSPAQEAMSVIRKMPNTFIAP